MNVRTIPILLTIVLCAACRQGDLERFTETVTRDSAGVHIVETGLLRSDYVCHLDAEPAVRIGDEETDAEILDAIRGVGVFADGGFAVVNGRYELRTYDQAGNLTGSHSARGEGPSEFRNAFMALTTVGDSIWVGDYRPWRYLVFDRSASWVRTAINDPQALNSPEVAAVLDNGLQVQGFARRAPLEPTYGEQKVHVRIYNNSGALIDSLGTFPDGVMAAFSDVGLITNGLFDARTKMASHGNRVVIGSGATPELSFFTVSRDGAVLDGIIRWDAGDLAVSRTDVQHEHEQLRNRYAQLDDELRSAFLGIITSPDRAVADNFPAYEFLIYGKDGQLWLQDYRRPGSPAGRRWTALDADGSVRCTLEMPDFDEVAGFGSDFVVVVEDLESGLEAVSRYGFSRMPAE